MREFYTVIQTNPWTTLVLYFIVLTVIKTAKKGNG